MTEIYAVGHAEDAPARGIPFERLLARTRGQRPSSPRATPDDTAVIMYTSGTTGSPRAPS